MHFPGSTVDKNLLTNAGDKGSTPDLGGFPHAKEQLSLRATTPEPVATPTEAHKLHPEA